MIKSVVVVCSGNICRSPMGEALLKRLLPDVAVSSAGLNAMAGTSADPRAVELLREHKYDLSNHRARRLTTEIVASADLILTMTIGQKRFLETRYVHSRGKVFRVCELSGVDIEDPFTGGPVSYARVFEQVTEGMSSWASQIVWVRRRGQAKAVTYAVNSHWYSVSLHI